METFLLHGSGSLSIRFRQDTPEVVFAPLSTHQLLNLVLRVNGTFHSVAIALAVACIFLHSVHFPSWVQLFDSVFPWTWCPVSQHYVLWLRFFCYCYFDFFSPSKLQVLNSAVQRPLKSQGNCWKCKRRQLKIAAVLWGSYPPYFFFSFSEI